MRFARTIVLVGVALVSWAFGPGVLLVGALALLHPRVRSWLRPTRRALLIGAATLVVLAGAVWLVPDGWVRIPPGPGALATPAYVGRPTLGAGLGPSGESPQVDTRFYGLAGCERLEPVADGRLVTVCGGQEPVLRLVDATSLRQVGALRLPGSGCVGRLSVRADRVVVSSAQQVLSIGLPGLDVHRTVDLAGRLAAGDCVVGLAQDGDRSWFVSDAGVVGTITGTASGTRIASLDLGEGVAWPLAVSGRAAYVAGETAVHRIDLRAGRPVVAWTERYDSGRPGSAPVPLPGGLVATAINRDPRLQVVVRDEADGAVHCRAEVFDDGEGSADGGLVAAENGVVVQNAHGYDGPRSTLLGRNASRGIARVEVVGDECRVAWTSDLDAPSGVPAVAPGRGIVYLGTKRHSWLGVDAWYLSALDLRTGRLVWAQRAGLGALFDSDRGAITLAPGAAYLPVLGGLVRVADRADAEGGSQG